MGVTNATGVVQSLTEYDAYGTEYTVQAGANSQFRFAGKHGYQTDTDTGLDLLGHRYYSPKLGRFITQDPLGHDAGLNLYAYCDNGPLGRVDADGLDWDWAQYWGDVGSVFKGYGKAVLGIVTGPIDLARYRIKNGFTPYADAVLWAGAYHSFVGCLVGDRGAEGFGESFGTILIAVASMKAGSAKMPAGPTRFAAASSRVTQTAESIASWLGPNSRGLRNAAGDPIFLSADGNRRVRFDFNNFKPHDGPHMHVDQRVNGKWAPTQRFFGKDTPRK